MLERLSAIIFIPNRIGSMVGGEPLGKSGTVFLTPKSLIVVLLMVALVSVACNGNGSQSSNRYKTLTVKNRIASFSCEYRAYYNDLDGPGIVDSAAHRFTSVHILAPKKYMTEPNPELGGKGDTVKMDYIPASIGIMAADATKGL